MSSSTHSAAENSLFTRLYQQRFIGVGLLLLLTVTRSGLSRTHFGDHLALPDASWAAFWLAGVFASAWVWPVLLMLASVAIDYYVIAHGVSSYCFTPAYPFLLPAYGSLWWFGRMVKDLHGAWWLRAAASLFAGISLCFVISNVGFYLAAGYFADMPASVYARAVFRYWPRYEWYNFVYVIAAVSLGYGLRALRQTLERQPQQS